MAIKVLRSAKLSLLISEGPLKKRAELISQLEEQVFRRVNSQFRTKEASLENIQESLKIKTLKNKYIDIMGMENDEFMGSSKIKATIKAKTNSNNNICGYKIQLPLNKDSKKVNLKSFGTFMYNFNHFLNYIVNPKFIKRTLIMLDKNQFTNTHKCFFEQNLYNGEHTAKTTRGLSKKLKDFITDMSSNERINFLQDCRYKLMCKEHAYKSVNMYQKKIETLYPDLLGQKSSPVNYPVFKFNEKIKILEELLKTELRQERKLHAESLTQNNSVL